IPSRPSALHDALPISLGSANEMKGARTLARLTDVASHRAVPFLGKVFDAAKRQAEHLSKRMLGEDFDERVEWLRRRYDAMGGDRSEEHTSELQSRENL